MAGLVDIEMVVPPTATVDDVGVVQGRAVSEATRLPGSGAVSAEIQDEGVIASSSTGRLASDFDPSFFVKTHPMSFPHGAGAVPQGMSLETYAKVLVERMVGRPAAEGGEDVMLILSLFNVLQRHDALRRTKARMRGTPSDFRKLDGMTDNDFDIVIKIVTKGMLREGFICRYHAFQIVGERTW